MLAMADPSQSDQNSVFADKQHAKTTFARRLQHELTVRGMNGSELSRRASAFMPEGKSVSRDNVSNYLRGLHLPGEVMLHAIAKALGVETNYLLPDRGRNRIHVEQPAFSMKDIGNGKVLLRVNQEVEFGIATRIASILSGME